jgi:hypothetical protein
MTRAIAVAALATTLAAATLGACATTPAQNRDVVAVVQDEQSRQAVAEAIDQGKAPEAALSRASEASELTPPH